MPANFERVDKNTRCTQADMSQLQLRANASTITGKPYDFSSIAAWKTELVRLRGNCLKKLRLSPLATLNESDYGFNYPYRREAITSGPWPFYSLWNVGGHNILPVSRPFEITTGAYPDWSKSFSGGIEYDEAEFIFQDSTDASMNVEVMLSEVNPGLRLVWYSRDDKEVSNGTAGNPRQTSTFEVDLRTAGITGTFVGGVHYTFVGQATPSQYEISSSHSVAVEHSGGAVRVRFNIQTADTFFFIKLTRKAGCPNVSGPSISSVDIGSMKWSHTITSKAVAGGIDRSNSIYKFTLPASIIEGVNNNNFGAFAPGADVNGVKVENPDQNWVTFKTYTWFGNLGRIRFTPSPGIHSRGIWKAKSICTTGGLHAGNFNPLAGDSTVSTDEFPAISTATEFQIPAYHWKRDTDTVADFPEIPANQAAGYGWVINEVCIVRNPARDGDYYFPDTTDPVTISIGCIRNGSFVSFQTVTIPAGSADATIYPFWPIFTRDYLVYQCDSTMQIYARVIATTQGTAPNAGRGSGISLPILSDHYNDTMAMLEAVVDLAI